MKTRILRLVCVNICHILEEKMDLLLDSGDDEKQFNSEMKQSSGYESSAKTHGHTDPWLFCLWPWRQLGKKRREDENKMKTNDEERRDKMRREKSGGVQNRWEGREKKEGTAKEHSCPNKEQMSPLFFNFPSCCTRRIHVREEGEAGRRQGGWEEEREEDQD